MSFKIEDAVNNFRKGLYENCLNTIQSLPLYNNLEESVLSLINCSVCEGLICLSNNGSVEEVEKNLYDICQQCLPTGYPYECIPLNLELTALFNYAWWQLSTTDIRTSNACYRLKWQPLLETAMEMCDRILGDTIIMTTDSTMGDLLHKLREVLSIIMSKDRKSVGIYLELSVLILIATLLVEKKEDSIKSHALTFIESILISRHDFQVIHSKILKDNPDYCKIFKFGVLFGNCTLAEIDAEHACNLLGIVASVCATDSQETIEELSLTTSSILKPLWNYLEALKKWKSRHYDESLGLLLDGFDENSEPELLSRYQMLFGLIYSKNGDRRKAVEKLKKAADLEKSIPVNYYHLGYQYGKMGLHDLMLHNYKKLLKAVRKKFAHSTLYFMLDKRILELVHDDAEINSAEALYVLAVAYGLNEMFDEATEVFESLLRPPYFGSYVENTLSVDIRTIKLPSTVTLLHEAAVMNLLVGNLPRCEELCLQAMDNYPAQDQSANVPSSDTHGRRDTQWIKKLIKIPFETENEENIPQYEEYVSFFEEDIVGLLILSEVQRIEEREDSRINLNKALLLLSKQIARLRKDAANDSKTFLCWEPLVKALTSKTCLQIAVSQKDSKPFADVDKMFRRALSCNNGDKDVLFHYAQYLLSAGKATDVNKLMSTFLEKDSTLNVIYCESLALRFLLRSHVSLRDLQDTARQVGIKR